MSGANLDLNASITEIDRYMIVTLSDNMTDDRLMEISSIIIGKAHARNILGAVLNFGMVSMIDSYIYKVFADTSRALSLFGVRVVWVGLSPGVVCSMIDLNIELDSATVQTALNLEQGLSYLSAATETH
jgi:anti-anti-sigma regulatory factor